MARLFENWPNFLHELAGKLGQDLATLLVQPDGPTKGPSRGQIRGQNRKDSFIDSMRCLVRFLSEVRIRFQQEALEHGFNQRYA